MVCGQPLAQLQVEKLEIRRLGDSSAPVPRAVTDYMDSQWGQKAMRPTIRCADGMEFAVDPASDGTIEMLGCSIQCNHLNRRAISNVFRIKHRMYLDIHNWNYVSTYRVSDFESPSSSCTHQRQYTLLPS